MGKYTWSFTDPRVNTSSNRGHPSNKVHSPSSVISEGFPPTSGLIEDVVWKESALCEGGLLEGGLDRRGWIN